jgi:hypothetical protein
VLRRHQPGIVTKILQLTVDMMRADASLHADQAGRHVGKSCTHFATRSLLPQHIAPL